MRRGPNRVLLVVAVLAGTVALVAAAPTNAAAAGWQPFTSLPPFNPGVMFLLTDGRVMVQDQGMSNGSSGDWWLLTPDAQGDYADGTWAPAASMPSGYAPLYGGDAVLPDGRLIVEGGEYDNGSETWTNQGAVYDPVANTWTAVAPPDGGTGDWSHIGDAPAVVLADGRFLLGASGSRTAAEAILHPANLTWTTTGAGKTADNAEAGFTLLSSGKVLTVDADLPSCAPARNSEIYDPASGTWASAGLTPSPMVPCAGDNAGEIGPQLGMYDGNVFVEGATGVTAVYDTAGEAWSAGPNFPVFDGQQFVASDAASAILPDGKVLLDASPDTGDTPTHFFLFDGTSLTQVADDAGASIESSHDGYMLVLPTGQVMFDYRRGPSSLELYSDGGTPSPAWAPQVDAVPSDLAAGQTYGVSGTQLSGLSEGAAFGDDYQMSTDYPLVQIVDNATGAVTYARTSGMTNRSIAPGAVSCTDFTLPASIPEGASELRVIANGIASAPVSVTVGAAGDSPTSCADFPETLTVTDSGSGSGLAVSSPLGIDCGSICSHAFPIGTEVRLTGLPDTGSRFVGWSGGGCAGTNTCIVTMSAAATVTATFSALHTLTVATAGTGVGTVTSSPAGIDCGSTCSHSFDAGTAVALTASPEAGSTFAGWSGVCSGTGACQLPMTADSAVTATFDATPPKPACRVPKVKGRRLGAAKSAIRRAHCRVGKIRRVYSPKVKSGRVVSQKPRPRTRLAAGSKVRLTVSKGKKR
jgi:PASTA domain/Divergent InlB B-repeat domain